MSPGLVTTLRILAALAGVLLLGLAAVAEYRKRRGVAVATITAAVSPDRRKVYDAIIEQAEYARATGKQEIANAAVMAFTDLVRIDRPAQRVEVKG